MKSINRAKIHGLIFRYFLLALGTVVFALPMIYMISTSLRPNGALYEYPPRFFPRWEALTLENYGYILSQSKFHVNFLNSAFVSLSTIILAAAVSSAMAFADMAKIGIELRSGLESSLIFLVAAYPSITGI